MGASTHDIFGNTAGEPATPGSYGEAPRGHRLPGALQLGAVRLRVANLARSVEYYTSVLGLQVVERVATRATLAPVGSTRALVELHEVSGVVPAPRRGRLGLFHFAILLPDRASLGQFVMHLAENDVYAGAGDHLVSEAFYLTDPDGLGIEVYADRPRDTWRRSGRELMMATDPVDTKSLIQLGSETKWAGMPATTVMGHLHLHVGAIEKAAAFYSEALGLDRIVWSYPGALFMSAGGYHHHLGTNTWAGAGAIAAQPGEAALMEWTIELPDEASVAATAASLGAAGYAATPDGRDLITADPWGTALRLRPIPR